MKRTNLAITISAALIALACAQTAAQAADGAQTAPAAIISAMEKKMNPDAKTEMKMKSASAGITEEFGMTSYARDNNQRIIVRFSAPAKMVGNDLLMMDRNVWLYDAKAGREMKIPSNQSFGGTGFSYGDVLRLNYTDNYTATLLSENDAGWTIELTAKLRDAPYFRIVLTVAKDFTPVLGKCYTRAGELIKEMVYSDFADAGSGKKPLTVTVTSPIDPTEKSSLTIVRETKKSYPETIFNKKNLAARLEDSL